MAVSPTPILAHLVALFLEDPFLTNAESDAFPIVNPFHFSLMQREVPVRSISLCSALDNFHRNCIRPCC